MRAILFARAKAQILLWVVAKDQPMSSDDKALKGDQIQKYRERWLHLHDKQTNGILGLFPCVRDMPVRFTDTMDRERGIFKNARGILKGWQLQPLDAQRASCEDCEELVLTALPEYLFVHIPGMEWVVDDKLGKGVYPLKPVFRHWTRDRDGYAKVRRRGFQLVPDFSGTAHSLSLIHI